MKTITKRPTPHGTLASGRGVPRTRLAVAAVWLAVGALLPSAGRAQTTAPNAATTPWVATWGTGMSGATNDRFFLVNSYAGTNVFNNQCVRLIVHTSLGGKQVRIRLSNEQSLTPVFVGSAHIAVSDGAANIVDGTDHVLTFGGAPSIRMPSNAPIVSDPVTMDVPVNGNLAISLFFPLANTTVATGHPLSIQYSYASPADSGDVTGSVALPLDPVAPSFQQWPLLSGVEVRAPGSRTFVVLGSSVANGSLSTIDANHRWPDYLSKRFARNGLPVSVVDASVVANPLLHNFNGDNALARFDRDVLGRPGVAYVLINDIIGVELNQGSGTSTTQVTTDEVLGGLRQYVTRAHAAGVKAYAATILPLNGATGYSDDFETKRQAINAVIRAGTLFDGYADFDAVIRDPADPTRILAAYDGGDHHHLNDDGYKLVARAVDLALFQ